MNRISLLITGMLLLLLGIIIVPKGYSQNRPNIIIILADDLGYTDVGCYGATKVSTPAIDRLADEGMRFTDAHSPAASCSPSRYGLVTGEYPFRNPPFARLVHPYFAPLGIRISQPTIASLARSEGYVTGVVGKWHMGLGNDHPVNYNGEIKPGPLEVGFDECFIEPANLHGGIYVENHHVVGADPGDPFFWETDRPGWMILKGGEKARIAKKPDCSRVFTEKAVSFITTHKYEPFLLYFAPNNVHVEIEPGEEFTGKSDCGLYGDYIMELDWMVAQVLEALDCNGLAKNTIVLFSSDNGGGYYKPHNAQALALGHRINGELLGQKTDVWEGGQRVPFIVRWPEMVKPDTKSDALVSLTDVMATMGEILDVSLPEGTGPDSYSFLHALTGSGDKDKARNVMVYQGHYEGLLAVRQGDWVLIPAQGSDGTTLSGGHNMMSFAELGFVNSDYTAEGELKPDAPSGQLYNLSSDPSQTTNLYREYHEKVEELSALLEKIKQEGHSR